MPHRAASPAASENEFDITRSLFNEDAGSDNEFGAPSKAPVTFDAGAILDLGLESDGDEAFIASQQAAANRKASNVKGKSAKKGGGFQAMGMESLPRTEEPC
jgi:ATP-dependent RNA helicase DDX54/DBP10